MAWEPLKDRSGPTQWSDALDEVAERLNAPPAHVLKTVFAAWDELVGSVMAAHSWPVRLADQELIVAVDDPAWATELKFFGAEIVARINAAAGEDVVAALKVRVRPQQ